MIFLGLAILCFNVWASYPQQNIEYDVFNNKTKVGTQTVTISYLPSSLEKPLGGRIIEVFTTLELDEYHFEQRSTAQFSGSNIKFISASSLNKSNTELQGRLKNDGTWLIHKIGEDTEVFEFSNIEMEMPSIAFYDPVFSQQLLEKKQGGIFFIEHQKLLKGTWVEKGVEKQRVSGKKIEGMSYVFDAEHAYQAVWSDTGLLMSWQFKFNEMDVKGKIKSLPEQPDFGQIESLKSFQGVLEEEL
ncbi:MAG: hypothetical protein CMK59_11670 [Proteobacteria bacterium]|nr:hypothetical protein [Pseudomonadota bacterium]